MAVRGRPRARKAFQDLRIGGGPASSSVTPRENLTVRGVRGDRRRTCNQESESVRPPSELRRSAALARRGWTYDRDRSHRHGWRHLWLEVKRAPGVAHLRTSPASLYHRDITSREARGTRRRTRASGLLACASRELGSRSRDRPGRTDLQAYRRDPQIAAQMAMRPARGRRCRPESSPDAHQ